AFLASLPLYFGFDSTQAGFQFVYKVLWIKSLNVSYNVGIDGISLLLILLTTFLTPLTLLSSWQGITKKVKEFTVMMPTL
ncbi:MAG TPA: Fe-S-binding domain-containing protein, partial [Ignavibacteriales bacterium]|nr:Fe-S-binding domain-containing protein [Ignavibacteriales bacterium]